MYNISLKVKFVSATEGSKKDTKESDASKNVSTISNSNVGKKTETGWWLYQAEQFKKLQAEQFNLKSPFNDTRTCFSYDPQNNDWREIRKMRKTRTLAACCVFAGGSRSLDVDFYDPETNSSTYMASVVHKRYEHCSVPNKNKIYMIGGNEKTLSNEVFDAYSNTFTLIQAFPWAKNDDPLLNVWQPATAVCIGKKNIAVVSRTDKNCEVEVVPLIFDVDLEKWCNCDFSFSSENYCMFTVVKYLFWKIE